MKTLQELNTIINENRNILIEDMFDYGIENPDTDMFLYIDIKTGETEIRGSKTDEPTKIYVDYIHGFDLQQELIYYWAFISEIEIVERYGLEKEYEEAREDLEGGNYAFGDFLSENGVLESVEEELTVELFEDMNIQIENITEENYNNILNSLEVNYYEN